MDYADFIEIYTSVVENKTNVENIKLHGVDISKAKASSLIDTLLSHIFTPEALIIFEDGVYVSHVSPATMFSEITSINGFKWDHLIKDGLGITPEKPLQEGA